MMLDPDDETIIRDCKAGGVTLVTWDKVMREAAGGLTPIECLQQAKEEAPVEAPPEAKAEIGRLIRLTPEQLTVMANRANETYKLFQRIPVDKARAKIVRHLRVTQNFSWRAVARRCALLWEAPWGANQIAGMVLCRKAAKLLGEDFMKEPWN